MRKLMAEQWDEFSKILPPNCSVVQKTEMRRAFYGFKAQLILYELMSSFDVGSGPSDTDVAIMKDLTTELSEFANSVANGGEHERFK